MCAIITECLGTTTALKCVFAGFLQFAVNMKASSSLLWTIYPGVCALTGDKLVSEYNVWEVWSTNRVRTRTDWTERLGSGSDSENLSKAEPLGLRFASSGDLLNRFEPGSNLNHLVRGILVKRYNDLTSCLISRNIVTSYLEMPQHLKIYRVHRPLQLQSRHSTCWRKWKKFSWFWKNLTKNLTDLEFILGIRKDPQMSLSWTQTERNPNANRTGQTRSTPFDFGLRLVRQNTATFGSGFGQKSQEPDRTELPNHYLNMS